jgi:transcriptional regulator with XRE-family HTH domain
MEVSRTVNNFSEFKKTWFEFEIDWLLHKGIKKAEIASALGMTAAALSNALSRMPSDAFLDRFSKAYQLAFVVNKSYEGYGIFYVERGNVLSAINYPGCRPMNEESKYFCFSDFKKAWLAMELNDLKDKDITRKTVAKKLKYSKVGLSIYTSRTLSDNFADKYCELYNVHFSVTKYFNEEAMAINGKFSLNKIEDGFSSNSPMSEPSMLSKMYMKVSEEKYNLELELKRKDEEISELKRQITLLKSENNQK